MPVGLSPELDALVRAEVEQSSQAAVARRCKISAAALSQLLAGTYTGSAARLEPLIKAAFNGVQCPHLAEKITLDACTNFRTREMPQSSAPALRHWRACQTCPIFPPATGAKRATDVLGASNAPQEVA
jgi:hypothetical protein